MLDQTAHFRPCRACSRLQEGWETPEWLDSRHLQPLILLCSTKKRVKNWIRPALCTFRAREVIAEADTYFTHLSTVGFNFGQHKDGRLLPSCSNL